MEAGSRIQRTSGRPADLAQLQFAEPILAARIEREKGIYHMWWFWGRLPSRASFVRRKRASPNFRASRANIGCHDICPSREFSTPKSADGRLNKFIPQGEQNWMRRLGTGTGFAGAKLSEILPLRSRRMTRAALALLAPGNDYGRLCWRRSRCSILAKESRVS